MGSIHIKRYNENYCLILGVVLPNDERNGSQLDKIPGVWYFTIKLKYYSGTRGV